MAELREEKGIETEVHKTAFGIGDWKAGELGEQRGDLGLTIHPAWLRTLYLLRNRFARRDGLGLLIRIGGRWGNPEALPLERIGWQGDAAARFASKIRIPIRNGTGTPKRSQSGLQLSERPGFSGRGGNHSVRCCQ